MSGPLPADAYEVGEIDLDGFPDDCWKCDVREATTPLGLCGRCDHELRGPGSHAQPAKYGSMSSMTDDATKPGPDAAAPEGSAEKAAKAKSLGAVAKDESIVHAPEKIAGGPSAVKTGRYLTEAKPDASEADLPDVGEVAETDVFVELLDNSATPRYRQIATAGLPFYSPIG